VSLNERVDVTIIHPYGNEGYGVEECGRGSEKRHEISMRQSFPSYHLPEKGLMTREERCYSRFEASLTFFILIRSSSSIWPLRNTLTATTTPSWIPLYTSAYPPDATGELVSTTSPLEMLWESGSKQWVPQILRKSAKHFCRRGVDRSGSCNIWPVGELSVRRNRDG
jgi:hypothetical protein